MKKFNYKSPIFKKYIMSYLIVIFVMTLIMSTWSIGNYKKYKRENIKNAEIAAENFGKNFDKEQHQHNGNDQLDRFDQYQKDIDEFYNKVLEKNG